MTDEETTELRSEIKVKFIVYFYFRLLKDMITYCFGLSIIIFEVNVQPLLNFVTVGFSKLYTLEFRIIFGNWQVGGELRNYISKFGSNFRTSIWNSEIQIACLPRNIKDVGEKTWRRITKLDGFFSKLLDVGESTVTYKTLKENKFRTRMQIALHFICIRVLNIFSVNVLSTVDSPTSRWFRKECFLVRKHVIWISEFRIEVRKLLPNFEM